jgi:hypothetical protein
MPASSSAPRIVSATRAMPALALWLPLVLRRRRAMTWKDHGHHLGGTEIETDAVRA